MTALIAAALIAAVVLTGCGKASDDGGGKGTAGTAAIPAPAKVETVTAEPGKATTAGPWTVVVKDVQRGSKFGRHTADEGGLIMVEVELTNNTANPVPVEAKDFAVTDGESYTIAVEGDNGFLPSGIVEPGATLTLKTVYFVPPFIESNDLSFAFQNAAVEMMRIEVPLK